MMLDKLGKGIVLRETIALHSCLIYLVMPLVGYEIFTQNNALSRLWVKYMPVPYSVYFGYALPAISGFVITLCWPITGLQKSDAGVFLEKIFRKAKTILQDKPKTGVYLLITGTVIYWFSAYLPTGFYFAFFLFFFARLP